jgi:predicted small metal-binding protein
MDKELRCRDIGLDCDSVVCGKTDEEVVTKAGQHVLATHGIEGFSKEFYNKARSAIREGYCSYGEADETSFDCGDECCC